MLKEEEFRGLIKRENRQALVRKNLCYETNGFDRAFLQQTMRWVTNMVVLKWWCEDVLVAAWNAALAREDCQCYDMIGGTRRLKYANFEVVVKELFDKELEGRVADKKLYGLGDMTVVQMTKTNILKMTKKMPEIEECDLLKSQVELLKEDRKKLEEELKEAKIDKKNQMTVWEACVFTYTLLKDHKPSSGTAFGMLIEKLTGKDGENSRKYFTRLQTSTYESDKERRAVSRACDKVLMLVQKLSDSEKLRQKIKTIKKEAEKGLKNSAS